MADGMRKSWLEGVSDLLKMRWMVGAGARMHHWLGLIPDQAFSPSAGVEGGGGGARPGEAVKMSSCQQPGRARQLAPTAMAPQGWRAGPRLTLECPHHLHSAFIVTLPAQPFYLVQLAPRSFLFLPWVETDTSVLPVSWPGDAWRVGKWHHLLNPGQQLMWLLISGNQ